METLFAMIQAAVQAGRAVLEVYHSDFRVTEKNDHSPLTLADLRAHEIIASRLEKMGLPILSEEGRDRPYAERRSWETFFMVDPLDGTKEFIKRNGEFTINIALINGQAPAAGVILVPVKRALYFAGAGAGARKLVIPPDLTETLASNPEATLRDLIFKSSPLPLASGSARSYTIIGSRSHSTPELQAFVEKCRRERGNVEFISAGSSLKFCLVAEGTADVYPRTGPTCEWDTAAGQAIAEHAGAMVEDFYSGRRLQYNKEDLRNPWFVVRRKTA